ncbi:MAG: hypothetical protein M1820_000715 [Bogoriella megaspora]|nr:MAG: hypothetical protein M1820_000715 [Bogoriella megaspora]
MSQAPAVTPTWAISQSATDVLSISKGLIAAATTDNVQVIALAACEAFGATLPICLETRTKVELLCSRSHQSAVVSFIKLQIGYQKGDSGWHLAQSDAGVRFLALAACLLTTDWWAAAEMLRGLLIATAVDNRLIPTSKQLKQLLIALNYRLSCSGFADNVCGWRSWLDRIAQQTKPLETPSGGTLGKLIVSLSELDRLGEARTVHIDTNMEEAPWMTAFIKWCLGFPPLVVDSGDQETLVHGSSRVIVSVPSKDRNVSGKTTIRVQHEIGSIDELWDDFPARTYDFKGMVHLRTIVSPLLGYFGPEGSSKRNIAHEVISYFCFFPFPCKSIIRPTLPDVKNFQSEEVSVLPGEIFPANDVIASVLAEFLDVPTVTVHKETTPLERLSAIDAVLSELEPFYQSGFLGSGPVLLDKTLKYFERIGRCVALTLLASLFVPNNPDGAFFQYSVLHSTHYDSFTTGIISEILDFVEGGGSHQLFISHQDVLGAALHLVGHTYKNTDQNKVREGWIMSGHYGQVIYLEYLGASNLARLGMLCLACVPGLIMHQGEKYNFVGGVESATTSSDPINKPTRTVTKLPDALDKDPYKETRIVWNVSAEESRLVLSLAIKDEPLAPNCHPMQFIWAATGLNPASTSNASWFWKT